MGVPGLSRRTCPYSSSWATAVYKLRKPVRFDFLDFTDREARRSRLPPRGGAQSAPGPRCLPGRGRRRDGRGADRSSRGHAGPPRGATAGGAGPAGADAADWIEHVANCRCARSFHALSAAVGRHRSPAAPEAIRREWQAELRRGGPFVGPVLDPAIGRGDPVGWSTSGCDRHRELLRMRGGQRGGRATATATSSPRTSSASTTASGSSTASNSPTSSAAATSSRTWPSWPWTWSVSVAPTSPRCSCAESRLSGAPIPASLLHHYVAVAGLCARQGGVPASGRSPVKVIIGGCNSARSLHALALRHLRAGPSRARPGRRAPRGWEKHGGGRSRWLADGPSCACDEIRRGTRQGR